MSHKPIAYVIEDNPDLAEIFADAISRAGYETSVISDGAEALSRIHETTPHLILLDLHLPRINGHDILRNLGEDLLKKIRILVASADHRMADSLSGLDVTILHKPVGVIQLRKLAGRFHPDQK